MQHPSLAKENKLYEHTSTMKPQDLANRSKGRPGGGGGVLGARELDCVSSFL